MAHLLRGKQAGIQNDLSAGLTPELFAIDEIARFGVNSQISCMAYDPVQSLLAVGTRSSQFGPGQIYVFGKGRVQIVLTSPTSRSNLKTLQFCAEKIVALDSNNSILIFSIELKRLVSSHAPPGTVTVLCTDPMLDYAFLGMNNGDILAYDMDRETLAPFRLPSLWSQIDASARQASIVTLQLHPRDVGTLLIGYVYGAVIYSFKLNKPLRHFLYEIPRGAPGGDANLAAAHAIRRPRLTQAVWHPTGTFIMTGYEDSSIVFWDTIKDGRILMARTIAETNIATPGAGVGSMQEGRIVVKEPLFKMSWCANHPDPEDTAILIAGGQSKQSPMQGLTLYEMGRTPVYTTSSWQVLADYFESPKRQRVLPTPPGAEVTDFCLIPKTTPHFGGAHDPIAVLALLSSGEILSLSFPSGMPISPTNQLPISLSLVHPFVKSINSSQVERERWLGLQERRQQGLPPILQGGMEIPLSVRKNESRSIVQTIHADGTIRLWDPGYGDEIENEHTIQVDVARAVGRYDGISVSATSFAGASAELAVGLRSGEFLIFRWGTNKNIGREPPPSRPGQPGYLQNISDRIEPSLSQGLCPAVMLDQQDGPVTAVCMSEIGFAAAAYEGGNIVVVDLRGPALILNTSVQEFHKHHKIGSIRRRASSVSSKPEWGTQLQFSIMTLEGEDYSSICLHIGTNLGHLATFKILPDHSGRYSAQLAGTASLDSSRIIYIAPISIDTGRPATASQQAMGGLSSGFKVNGALLTVTPTGINIFRPATAKGAHKSFDNVFCDCARVVRYRDQGHALLALFGDGNAKAYAIPSLRELKTINLTNLPGGASLDVRRFSDATITNTGSILAFTGPSEVVLLTIWGTGESHSRRQDKLFNPERLIPPRPTISTVQWVTGTQYITPLDMDILIGGPSRPPSKRMIMQARAEEQQRQKASRTSATAAALGQQDEGYWAYMQRQIQERTEKLGIVGDGMDNLEQSSANWLEDVNKFVGRQKRNAATGIIKARFGL